MRFTYYIFILAFVGCGQSPSTQPVTVDPALAPYLTSFETNIGASAAGINVGFADTETTPNPLGETIGECQMWSDGTRTIQVDSAYWATASESDRTELMYHELGHCALYLQHITTLQASGCPTSIMYPYDFGNYLCFTGNESYYFQELGSHK